MMKAETSAWREGHNGFVDSGNWLEKLARDRVHGVLRGIEMGALSVRDCWGDVRFGNDADAVHVVVGDPRFYLDILFAGSNGAASAYRDGYWSCNNLTALFQLLLRNGKATDAMETGSARLGNWWLQGRHRARRNSRVGSRRNIHAHYDLGNEFFALFLDRTMTYSSGIFTGPDCTLEQASEEKLDRICRKLQLRPGQRVLEIGCGWGGFALHAASRYGCQVTAVTISRAQFELAQRRIWDAGVPDRVELVLRDYRDLQGQFDRIVSIEMIEAVGHDFLPEFFRKCGALLAPDGQMLLQAITMPDAQYKRYLRTTDFIQQFIFPGSCVPSLNAMLSAMAQGSGLRTVHVEDFGIHYARTLRHWLHNFQTHDQEIRALGYGEGFMRLWEYYLCYCEAGFLEHYTGVVQLLLHGPRCREHPHLAGF